MRFHPRHYVLIAVILALGIWNWVRLSHARHVDTNMPAAANTPGWSAFDHAASLRDAPEAQFTPALNALRAQSESATGPEATDLRGCQMWLLYYRHSAPMASGKPGDWAMLASGHVQSCLSNHRDIGR